LDHLITANQPKYSLSMSFAFQMC